jgi:hypothetical protein
MNSIGVPFGLILGVVFHNMGLLAIGFPFGIAIGMALGSSMDEKAGNQGKQLRFEMFGK